MCESTTSTERPIRISKSTSPSVTIALSSPELEALGRVADYYDRSMGPFRHVVRLTAGRETRERFRFVAAEAKILSDFIDAQRQKWSGREDGCAAITFTPRALVAFWGRMLSSLNSPRSRRKLKRDEIALREQIADLLASAVEALRRRHADVVEREIAMRKMREQTWMRQRLDPLSQPKALNES